MPNSIEIFENTLLKFVVRQGTDSERKNIKLTSGELGYTTDTKKLYVGDGSTDGGILVGNGFKGSVSDITTLAPAETGDLAYDSDNNKLYRLKDNDGSTQSDWEQIGGVYTSGDGSIGISSDNKITVGKLSASNLDNDVASFPIYLDGSNKIALSAIASIDEIYPRNDTKVTLFSALNINGLDYKFPDNYNTGNYLRVGDSGGGLVWENVSLSSISTNTITINDPLTSTANGVDSTGTAVNPLTANISIGASPTLSCYNLWARYDSSSNTIIANKGISTVVRDGVGRYTFTYDNPLSLSNPYVQVQVYGSSNRGYEARVVEANNIECRVDVYRQYKIGSYGDADFSLKVET